ncbi:phosphopentomutase [Patescibacteria group bacterium]|nr:phosphopentomutase [Patescibacteria group bacterium]MBU2459956.1 phosphopentomutase [Patescibacteria group bacterium]MBU2544802.1 phosphopentomutase [Patescibacteria group bacterium]
MSSSAERPTFHHVRVTIIDGAGCGEAINRRPQYPIDIGVNSISNASHVEPIQAPGLESIGLAHVPGLETLQTKTAGEVSVIGASGSLTPTFAGNGSPEGHQALMGHIVEMPYLLFDKTGFPPEIVQLVEQTVAIATGRQVEAVRYPGTDDVNGIKFINYPGIGDRHLAGKKENGPLVVPIYASSDSLIQIALHLDVVPQEMIEKIGKAVREEVDRQGFRIGRIIMRPFIGGPDPGSFTRDSEGRRDYGVDPDGPTLIDHLADADIPIYGIGKAATMLNYHGFNKDNVSKRKDDQERMKAIKAATKNHGIATVSFGFDNLVGTDELYGHTRLPIEYSKHIAMLDAWIIRIMAAMTDEDLWILTADHGNDPTQTKHYNHTNEMTPVLVYSPRIKHPVNLGVRDSFADVAKTVAENFGIADKIRNGVSFFRDLLD